MLRIFAKLLRRLCAVDLAFYGPPVHEVYRVRSCSMPPFDTDRAMPYILRALDYYRYGRRGSQVYALLANVVLDEFGKKEVNLSYEEYHFITKCMTEDEIMHLWGLETARI